MTFRALLPLALALAAPLAAMPARAGIGDLLVAPTRLVLDGRKGAEVILNNIGDEPATYRLSVEFRRMTADGGLADVDQPTAEDRVARDMIVYAPRRITLAPRQPQSIRIAARPPASATASIASICCSARFRPPPRPSPRPMRPRGSASR